MAYLLLGIALLLLALVLGRAIVSVSPATLARILRWGFGILIGLVLLALIASERIMPALALIGALLTIALRGHALWNQVRAAAGPSPGRTSEVETDFLKMTLDHDTGAMSGVIRRGPHQGSRLSELSQDDLLGLWRECRAADEASARLLETYLDRAVPNWREAEGTQEGSAGPPRSAAAMTVEEAYQILDLKPGATADEIKAAHRRLMLKLHPDHGGSNYLASRINQAKDLLLKSWSRR
jgi:DnaJ domain